MSTKTKEKSSRSDGRRPKYGKDGGRLNDRDRAEKRPRTSYWAITRRPLPCLAFITPFLFVYEFGVLWLSGKSPEALRNGADAWVRRGLAGIGLTDHWLLPLSLMVSLLVWQTFSRRDWKFSPHSLVGMGIESVIFAVALIGLSRVVDIGFGWLEQHGPPTIAMAASTSTASSQAEAQVAALVGFIGAGIYEEALFRLILIPALYLVLRLLQTPKVIASSLAITASALLFSLAHHAGMPGEAFTWYAFIFRWFAGIYFAWVFVVRGFGVAVGTHTAYDIMVGWFGWHL